jgi:hypothetical protein
VAVHLLFHNFYPLSITCIAQVKNRKCSFSSGAVVLEIRTSMPTVALLTVALLVGINLYARDHLSRARQILATVPVGLLKRLSAGGIM